MIWIYQKSNASKPICFGEFPIIVGWRNDINEVKPEPKHPRSSLRPVAADETDWSENHTGGDVLHDGLGDEAEGQATARRIRK